MKGHGPEIIIELIGVDKNHTAMFPAVIKKPVWDRKSSFFRKGKQTAGQLTVATICRKFVEANQCVRYVFCSFRNIGETLVIIFGNNKVPITFAKLPSFTRDYIALLLED